VGNVAGGESEGINPKLNGSEGAMFNTFAIYSHGTPNFKKKQQGDDLRSCPVAKNQCAWQI
jgi:hypothetical protein